MNFLTCPKCRGQMRQYERNGITLDQCTECRGIFLDHGELEQLAAAEQQWSGGGGGAPGYQQPHYQGRRHHDDDDDWDDDDDDRRRHQQYDDDGYQGRPHKRRKKSFLEGLFDG